MTQKYAEKKNHEMVLTGMAMFRTDWNGAKIRSFYSALSANSAVKFCILLSDQRPELVASECLV